MESPSAAVNRKSDVRAKEAFVRELLARGFESAKVTRTPADITALRGSQTYYFEIKYTAQATSYFGAATLTEWEAAMKHELHFRFVVAAERGGTWTFHEYTPEEFMQFSTIPPFKAHFDVAIGTERDTRPRGSTRSVRLTRERLVQMSELFGRFRTK